MADGAQKNGGELAQLGDGAVGEDFLGAEVSVSAEVEMGVVEADRELAGGGIEDLDGFPDNLRACAVSADHGDIVAVHGYSAAWRPARGRDKGTHRRNSAPEFNLKNREVLLADDRISRTKAAFREDGSRFEALKCL